MKAALIIQVFDPFTDQASSVRNAKVEVTQGVSETAVALKQREPHLAVGELDVTEFRFPVQITVTIPLPMVSGPPVPIKTGNARITGSSTVKLTTDLVITQKLKLTERGGTLSLAVPTVLHPRVKAKIESGTKLVVSVDARFIDLTLLLRGAKSNMFENYDRDFGAWELEPGNIHHGCELRILDLVTSKPRTWLVVIPPQAKAGNRGVHNLLIFFRPAFIGYQNTETVNLKANDVLAAHFRSEPNCMPFFWWGCNPAPSFHLPNAGWERQLTVSGKPVILVEPLPHGEDLGKVTEPNLTALLESLVAALTGDGTLPRGSLGKIGILGLSRGGNKMFECLENNKLAISEVYCFDPSDRLTPGASQTKLIADWFLKTNRNQKLRMVAGYGLKEMLDLEKGLSARNGDVSVIPKNNDFFNTPGNIYHKAVIPYGAAVTDEILAPLSGASMLSADTNIYLVDYKSDKDTTTLMLKGTAITKTLNATPIELAGIIRANWYNQEPSQRKPATTLAALNTYLSPDGISALGSELGDGHWIRHLWASAGGTGNPHKDPPGVQGNPPDGQKYEGHLLFCLKDSSFT